MYDAQIVRDFIERSGGFRAASRLASLNQMTIRSAANGGNITMATFQRLAYVIGVTGCQLLGGPCASKS